ALREALSNARTREPGARALACLHLEARLFGFPEDAAAGLCNRADMPELLPDLVGFLGEPGMDAMLAERPSVASWSPSLSAFDGPAVYRSTLQWASAPPAKAAVEAALGLVWRKIFEELGSRSRFAAPRRGNEGAGLFDRPGSVITKTAFTS